MSVVIDGTTGITTPAETVQGALTTTGNTILGDASTDTLNVGNGGLVKDASGNVGIGTASPSYKLDVASGDTTAGIGYAIRIRANATALAGALQFTDAAVTAQNGAIAVDTSANMKFYTIASERMRIDSSGNVTMPYQPAFSARMTVVTTTNAAEQKFGTVLFNTGSNYNATTGRFTAPVAGKYYFVFQMLTSNTAARALCYLAKNASSALPAVEASATASNYNSISAFGLFDLAAGDYISVVNATSAEALFYTSPSNQNWFIGYLVG